MDRYTIWYYL